MIYVLKFLNKNIADEDYKNLNAINHSAHSLKWDSKSLLWRKTNSNNHLKAIFNFTLVNKDQLQKKLKVESTILNFDSLKKLKIVSN